MGLENIIVDNTVFNFFLRIKGVDLSNILRNTIGGMVLVPSEIVNEMENIANKYPELSIGVEKFKNQIARGDFFIHCESFDSTVLSFAREYVDKGEAEAVAQCMKRRIPYFITDDFKCLPFILRNYDDINVNSTFFLIAVADMHGLINNYKQVFEDYNRICNYHKMSPPRKANHQARLRREYLKAAKLFGISLAPEAVVSKTKL
jgi:predicted nucleic acid-binding protein